MARPLFIYWNDDHLTGCDIVDEQHRGLISTINSMHWFIQEGWSLEQLKPTISILEKNTMFHLKTEETILRRKNFEHVDIVTRYSEDFLVELHRVVENSIAREQPQELSKFLARWWLGHNTEFHEKVKDWFGPGTETSI